MLVPLDVTDDDDIAIKSAGWRAMERLVEAQDRLGRIPEPDGVVIQARLDIATAIEDISYILMPNFDEMLREVEAFQEDDI